MTASHSLNKVKYKVTVHPVQEVTLIGTADLGYWRTALAAHELHPASREGRAEMIVSATSARFMGKRFRELSFSVFVSDVENEYRRDGVFMIHAYNSSRLFAWIERTFFHTPYHAAELSVSAIEPPAVLLHDAGSPLFRAQCGGRDPGNPRTPYRVADECLEVPIHLPSKATSKVDRHRLFHARLSGTTSFFAFAPALDVWDCDRRAGHRVIDVLTDCDFKPIEWQIRAAATHSKSKTSFRDS